MDKEKSYILQKDLPKIKAGTEFIFNKEFCVYEFRLSEDDYTQYSQQEIDECQEWFKIKEPNPRLVIGHQFITGGNKFTFSDYTDISISKERLSEILIAESKNELELYGVATGEHSGNKYYTEKRHIELLEECFNESRLTNPLVGFKHDTFSDYMNNLKK